MNKFESITTQELVMELSEREGVATLIAHPHTPYDINTDTGKLSDTGPAIILCVYD